MSFIVYLLVLCLIGLVVGALARLALPGRDPMSLWQTMAIGIGGSLLAARRHRRAAAVQPQRRLLAERHLRRRDRLLHPPLARWWADGSGRAADRPLIVGAGVDELAAELRTAMRLGIVPRLDAEYMTAAMVGAALEVSVAMIKREPPDVEGATSLRPASCLAGSSGWAGRRHRPDRGRAAFGRRRVRVVR
jgi:uncharacterized membrane protein YeaQ/YmgE (transglycosylase-associated protein family)